MHAMVMGHENVVQLHEVFCNELKVTTVKVFFKMSVRLFSNHFELKLSLYQSFFGNKN